MKPRGKINTAARAKAAREYLGLSKAELARVLRYSPAGRDQIRKIEAGDSGIPGPFQIAMEALVSGWRPRGIKFKIDKEANHADA